MSNNCLECPDSQFRRNCSGVCEGCVNSMCDHVSGRCDNTTHCNSGYEYSDFCDHLCDDGDFGIDCAQKCYCLTEPCSKGEGICPPVGCKEGWHGESCNMECSSGYFGRNCKHSCLGCLSHTCDRIDGLCKNTTGCKPGYLYTEFCNKTCDDGYFGQNCTGKCKCSTCNKTTGSCGVGSKSPVDGSSNVAAIGGGVAAVIIFVLVIVAVFIFYKRRLISTKERYGRRTKSIDNRTFGRQNETCNENEYANVNIAATIDDEGVTFTLKDGDLGCQVDDNGDENVYNNVTSEHDVSKYNILIEDLKEAIDEKQKDEGFKKEYEVQKKKIKLKNRFLSTWPYDHSRVILRGNTKNDYINASYIDVLKGYIERFLAHDLAGECWENSDGNTTDRKPKEKCEQYWPETVSEQLVVNNFKVTMIEERKYTFYVYRLLTVSLKNSTNMQERKIHHFHFIQWPDHGVPDSIKLVNFYRKVKSQTCEQNGPMVVHCSAGVGRTGTFIAIDALYQHGQKVGYVNVMEYIEMMRKDRMNMVQTHRLETLRPLYPSSAFTAATVKENISKNSAKNILAHDRYRPYLMSYGKTRSDYINAVIIPKKEQRKITVFTAPKLHVASDTMLPSNILLDLLKTVKDCWEEHKGFITVVSSDGFTKSGLFVALYLTLEKMEVDDEVDVFQVVRAMQNRRPEFLMELEQYEYCYKCIKEHLERDSLYANL
ncbi:unnamed protein product [Mytilus edulis]|uniref:Uncharacterized protein n=1 Tax=Mytilus edulis TaxID=6550 RepID=A0A8S3T7G0_MYTED|nr:unnamed protein product [Mytilus edulis]